MRQQLSSVKFSNKVNITKEFSLEENCGIWVRRLLGSLLTVEEFLETLLADLEKRLSEHRVLHVSLGS